MPTEKVNRDSLGRTAKVQSKSAGTAEEWEVNSSAQNSYVYAVVFLKKLTLKYANLLCSFRVMFVS